MILTLLVMLAMLAGIAALLTFFFSIAAYIINLYDKDNDNEETESAADYK